ncbi:hypothetical protein PK98_10820 [Croceibacterium mercuriale]|uniref:DUF1134 domain-containing protein n=2 Tax=Croceibacterium mercuriale TaxID=1572751 RepID=A0A0B2BUG2_9SPHN|nr:hypothetical protein PK98_10820 [Croceibacterium mercuriale]
MGVSGKPMTAQMFARGRFGAALLALAALVAAPLASLPAAAQGVTTIDPDAAIDGDLNGSPPATQDYPTYNGELAPADGISSPPPPVEQAPAVTSPYASEAATQAAVNPQVAGAQGDTYQEDDLIGAAEGLFGKGAEGLARLIQDILSKQGEPNAYVVGREASAAFIVGARYGSGTLFHKVEGQKTVYWTGPSVGFDAGANAGNTFVLVYNLFDSEELYSRFPAGEGQVYLAGGFTASYLRKGNVVLIPIRVGAGLRLGVNVGYMKFTRDQTWMPF